MTEKHTPGPWTVPDGGVAPMVAASDGFEIAALCDCGDVMEANARLIAAAPELLAALQQLRDALDLRADADTARWLAKEAGFEDAHGILSALQSMDAAIAKATGETP